MSTFTLSCLLLWKIVPSVSLSLFSLSQFISMVDKVFSGFCDEHFTGNKDLGRPRQVMQVCAPSTLDEKTGSRIQSQFRLNRVRSTWAT